MSCVQRVTTPRWSAPDVSSRVSYFEDVRDAASAVGPCLIVGAMFHPELASLPEAFLASPLGRELLILGKRVVSIHNDIFGYQRERRDGDVNNYVMTHMQVGCDEREAVGRAIRYGNDLYARFVALEERADRCGLRPWWEVVHWFIVGNFEWSTLNHRRFSTDGLVAGDAS